MRLNLLLLLFVSFLPFTTAIAATHPFASNLSLHEVTVSSPTERVAVVLFGLNLTLAALMVCLMLRHAGHTPDVAADDLAEEELQAFVRERRSAVLLQASATVVGVFLPLTAVVFYLALSIFTIVDRNGAYVSARATYGRPNANLRNLDALRLSPPADSGQSPLSHRREGYLVSRPRRQLTTG